MYVDFSWTFLIADFRAELNSHDKKCLLDINLNENQELLLRIAARLR
jgi:hypothetical protein